ncbi:bifunctional GNAT family N-acetyltransferase/NUDIX hydrolase [Saccharibacillus sp. O23]|uniref:bifunctional GNAT family N-acetyltransferase/NUDIX hydrolase n=1 Tax=Saccharibacillus sp. O23 TaxID=2009338 RepID=UPI0015C5ACCE|nr:bifunctional GNAT family N-acetyltransferase/NUDIX hydrolase [Saccharibacillus sp. O23]
MSVNRNQEPITLAAARTEDMEALRRIAIEAFAPDLQRYGTMPQGIETREWHEQGMADGSYLAIFAGERLAGGARIFDLGDGRFRLGSLFVDPSLHGRGIGSATLAAIEQRHPEAKEWSLDTPAGSERNHRFYRHAGYVKVGENCPDPASDFLLFDYLKLPLLAVIRDADLPWPAAETQERSIAPIADERNYGLRQAARAVLADAEGRIALMRVERDDYHKLPGGGIEGDEDAYAALRRELQEEVGANIEIGEAIGMTIEYVAGHRRKQFSYAYEARSIGSPSAPELTKSEQAAGFAPMWTAPEEAVRLMESDRPKTYVGAFIRARDLAILRTYLDRQAAE